MEKMDARGIPFCLLLFPPHPQNCVGSWRLSWHQGCLPWVCSLILASGKWKLRVYTWCLCSQVGLSEFIIPVHPLSTSPQSSRPKSPILIWLYNSFLSFPPSKGSQEGRAGKNQQTQRTKNQNWRDVKNLHVLSPLCILYAVAPFTGSEASHW